MGFWWAWIGLTRSLGCLGSKWVENEFLNEKNEGPCFFDHHRGQILGCASDASSANMGMTCLSYPSKHGSNMFAISKYRGLVYWVWHIFQTQVTLVWQDPRRLDLAPTKSSVT